MWEATTWNETVKINERAIELSKKFNAEVSPSRPISYTAVNVQKVVQRSQPNQRPLLNEYVVCEDFIPGEFNKWCSNYGYIGPGSSSLPAFMHWSWYHTKGEEMVADLQGVREKYSYKLTDPVIISLSETYGATDTRVEGMAMFFLSHTCNTFCKHLPKPTVEGFRGIIPDQYLQAAKTFLAQVHGSTTYKVELKFPSYIRERVAKEFRRIASQ